MIQYDYITISTDENTDLVKTLNEYGEKGYRFINIVTKQGFNRFTNQPIIENRILMERLIAN